MYCCCFITKKIQVPLKIDSFLQFWGGGFLKLNFYFLLVSDLFIYFFFKVWQNSRLIASNSFVPSSKR